MPDTQPNAILILGIGNLLWADEGFGVRAIEYLNDHYRFPEGVTLMDGGTQGIYLLDHIRAARVLIVFDAVDYGLTPGTLKIVRGEAVPHFMGVRKMSLHQTGFQEVLEMARLLGDYPEALILIGVQPEELEDYGGSLRPSVRAQLRPAVEAAVACLAEFGVVPEPHDDPQDGPALLLAPELAVESYEQGRPDPLSAPRLGDPRVLVCRQSAPGTRPTGPDHRKA